ncbi:MAG: hypothetical protein JOY79_09585 [Acidobacteriaceae bacterium]|nr:hypothetical protein [Acidobacteriaceae bacterium]
MSFPEAVIGRDFERKSLYGGLMTIIKRALVRMLRYYDLGEIVDELSQIAAAKADFGSGMEERKIWNKTSEILKEASYDILDLWEDPAE